jgi:PEGA domain
VVGTLVVNSEPQGAEVLINGVSQGRTPLRIDGLSAGSRVVRLELPGYERWSWAVRVVANRQTPLVVKLQPEGRRTGAN